MRIKIHDDCVSVWISARDTLNWAFRPGKRWPCSSLSGRRIFAQFDSNGLCDLAIDGKSGVIRHMDCDSNEFNAIMADFVGNKLPENHPCTIYFNQ